MRHLVRAAIALAAALVVGSVAVLATPQFGDSAFERVWKRQDLLIETGEVTDRSWTWGPAVSSLLEEEMQQSPGGHRRVQYFEKSRMEINDPNADPNELWYVTNGLLPIEMITGRMQTGYDYSTQYRVRGQARISALGDAGTFPTYADLLPFYDGQPIGEVDANRLYQPITTMLNGDGSLGEFTDFTGDPLTNLGQATGPDGVNRGIPQAFLDFMTMYGDVYEGRPVRGQRVFPEPLFVFGLPITEPYWVQSTVGGTEMPILFQIFERRVLTYNPANPLAFRVEMGNVGKHYYEWRYGSSPTPPPTATPEEPYPYPEP